MARASRWPARSPTATTRSSRVTESADVVHHERSPRRWPPKPTEERRVSMLTGTPRGKCLHTGTTRRRSSAPKPATHRPGRFAPDVDQVRTVGDELQRVADRPVVFGIAATVGERIGCHVQDADDRHRRSRNENERVMRSHPGRLRLPDALPGRALDGLRTGAITVASDRWKRPTVVAGGTLKSPGRSLRDRRGDADRADHASFQEPPRRRPLGTATGSAIDAASRRTRRSAST